MPKPMLLGTDPSGGVITLPVQALVRHVVALGSSGSGKTVACKVVVEEAVRNRIPSIIVDPQGDLASLGLIGDPVVRRNKGTSDQVAAEYLSQVEVKIWTPGSTCGIPISMSPCFDTYEDASREDQIKGFGAIGSSISAMAGYSDGEASRGVVAAVSSILSYADTEELELLDLNDLVSFLIDPPAPLVERIAMFFSAKDRAILAKRIMVRIEGSNKLLYELGFPIGIDHLLGYEEDGAYYQGKTRVSVIYLNSLGSQEEKALFVATLANALYARMIQDPCESPRALFYLDEAAPYMPPVRKPASKTALMNLLRQGRKYGIGCVIATQSPGDLDYTALGQVGTWMLGRMNTVQEAAKVGPAVSAQPGVNVKSIVDSLPALKPGQMVLLNRDHFEGPKILQSRWLVSEHRTLGQDDVSRIVTQRDRVVLGGEPDQ